MRQFFSVKDIMLYINVQHIAKAFGDKYVLKDVNFSLSAGQKIGLVGVNGSGKSTLIKLLSSKLHPDEGNITFSRGINIAYLEQAWIPKPHETVKDALFFIFKPLIDMEIKLKQLEQRMSQASSEELLSLGNEYSDTLHKYEEQGGYSFRSHINGVTKIRSILAQFRFVGDDVHKQISQLSGGEKARVALTKLMLSSCNLLVMDEPTNHLDSDSREVLEIALENYNGTILAVSHDRFFTNRIADKILHLEHGIIKVYEGNYNDFLFEQEKQKLHGKDYEPGITKTQLNKNRKRSRDEERKIMELNTLVKNAEKAVLAAEEKLNKLEQLLSNVTLYEDKNKAIEIIKLHEEAKEEVERKYSLWLEAEGNYNRHIEDD
ncbi:MAG: ATP-binding cassette domain-containing protein [Christensenellales bacterium]